MTVIDIDKLTLAKGAHQSCEDGMCLFEAYSMIAFNRHTDHRPADVSPVLHRYGMYLNDSLPADRRQELKRFLPGPDGRSVLSDTFGDGLDEARGYLALDWLIRTHTPTWLDLAGLTFEATALRDLLPIVDLVTAQAAGPVVRKAKTKAVAAWGAWVTARGAQAAAEDAAWTAARAAAGAAAGDAAGVAAEDAAWDAAGDAARVAAGIVARDAAGDAAQVAAGIVARDAAGDAAWDAGDATKLRAARNAARESAWAALKPTVDQLQTSAIALFNAMIRPEVSA